MIESGPRRQTQRAALRLKSWTRHGLRIAIVVGVLWLLRAQQLERAESAAAAAAQGVDLADVVDFFPEADHLRDPIGPSGQQAVIDHDGNTLGFVLQTDPASQSIIGYSGPTNTLLAFSAAQRLIGMRSLNSSDTPEYVRQVFANSDFQAQVLGRHWSELSDSADIDVVSGATLTSVAVITGVASRLGGEPPNLKFPKPVELAEVMHWFPSAQSLQASVEIEQAWDVVDATSERLGWVVRTTPAGDPITGHEGPTDTLIAFDSTGHVVGIAVHETYETEEYVDWIRDDDYFLNLFNGKTATELAEMDLFEEQVEGVSGATMTSMAMADAIKLRAAAIRPPPETEPPTTAETRFDRTSWSLIAIVALGLLMSATHLRGQRWLRVVYQLALIGYFAFVNSDLISQALLAGWAVNGIPWRIAPGLVLLTAAAFLVPVTSRAQMYCHHVCPFGAAQQLLHRVIRVRWHPPRAVRAVLATIPAALLALTILVATGQMKEFDLAQIEPFDAFNWRLATLASILIAAAGLAASCFIPMAYCRYGCPTGELLNYVRFRRANHWLTRRDIFALACLGLAYYFSG